MASCGYALEDDRSATLSFPLCIWVSSSPGREQNRITNIPLRQNEIVCERVDHANIRAKFDPIFGGVFLWVFPACQLIHSHALVFPSFCRPVGEAYNGKGIARTIPVRHIGKRTWSRRRNREHFLAFGRHSVPQRLLSVLLTLPEQRNKIYEHQPHRSLDVC